MLKNKTIIRCLFIAIVLAFGYGLAHLFLLRFESGDVYPPYSSLRSDPLGTRALHESLILLNPDAISRNYDPQPDLQFEELTSFLHLGTTAFNEKAVSEEFAETVDRLTAAGGRLVMAFYPVGDRDRMCRPCETRREGDTQSPSETDSEDSAPSDQDEVSDSSEKVSGSSEEESDKEKQQTEKDSKDEPDDWSAAIKTVSLKESWGVSFEYDDATEKQRRAVVNAELEPHSLPESISWHSALYFDDLDESWKVLYHQNGQAVIVERPYLRGAILLCADSFLFSNEALRSERQPALLARLIGPHNRVVFDEVHLGILKSPGVAELIRRFGFHWFFLTIALVFVLFIWKNSVHFVTPPDSASDGLQASANEGRDYSQGIMSLLRRNISVKNILSVSMAEWKKSFAHTIDPGVQIIDQTDAVSQAEETLSRNQADPVKAYNTICKLLSKRN
ncbi:MAG: hypothetical protein JRF72_22480 [Deltaproteobacteria bacterium]|nr:hypothetical protein [Deltaproteobacteria bacterium]